MELGARFSNTQKIIYLYITETRRIRNSFLVLQSCSIFILVIDFGHIYFILFLQGKQIVLNMINMMES